ncbi:MAG: tyrosine-type recombinase/integrase [Candidatus Omnitrophica bacterium]|nr:tyrosine-type recombinase/integrase [Candidatus Omnitrophota bacterium]
MPRKSVFYLGVGRKTSLLTEQGLYGLFKDIRYVLKSHKKVIPQMLRHTFCTLMLRGGVNLRDI